MKTSGPGLLPLLLALAGAPLSFAQAPPADPPPTAEEAQAKALRYYEALAKRPTGGYLFDRFYNAWLDTQTLDELEKYLTQRAEAAEATTGHRLILAFYYARQNASAKALELFARALEKDPGNAEAWYQKALAESRASNVDQALKDLEKALAAKPNKETSGEARQLQGRLLVRAGRAADASKVWESLLAENPADEDLREDLVEIQLTEGQTEDALKTAQGLLEKTKDPYKRVQRRLRVGDIQSRMGNRDAAIAVYAECLADVGGDSWLEREILSQIEQVYRKDDAVAEMREKFEALIKANPQRVALRRGLAKVQAELGEGEAALKTWQELLPLAPGDRALRESYVQMLADNKKIEEAVAQLQALIAQEPNDPELLMQLAEFYWRGGKKDDCLKTLQQFLTRADQTTEAASLRVAAQMERYELKEAALELYAGTAKKFGTSETALLGHAAALHRADKKDEARAAWRALASGADGPRLSAIARGVAAREEHALAEELLAARLKEFMGDATFLQFYCETALRCDREGAALAPARALLNLAKDTISLDSALTNAVRVLDRAKQSAAVVKELEAAAAPTMQERCLLAELLDKSGETKKAEAVLREVAKSDAVIGHAALVRVQSARGEFKSAAESQEALVNASGGRKAVHLQRLVELYEKAGLNDKALGWTAEWRKAAPGSVLVWIKESDLLAAAGKPADALRVMRQAAQQFPADEEIRLRLGEAFRTEGKFADAARIYTMLFEEAKDTTNKVRYAGELAKTAEMSGGMNALLEQFEERRKGNRGSILPLLALAEIHRAAGNYEGRRQALLEANRVKQGDPDLLLEIARIDESEGKYESALETLQEVRKLDKSGKADDRIIRVLFASGRDQEALQMFFGNAGGEKMDPRTAEDMVLDLMQMGLVEEGASILQRLTPLHPGDYRLGYLLAMVLIDLEQTEPGAAQLVKLLEIRNEMVLPNTGNQAQTQQAANYYDEFGGYSRMDGKLMAKLPPGLPDLLQFRRQIANLKSYQQNRRSGSSSGSRSVAIPASLERLRDAVLQQCFMLAEELTTERKAILWKEVAARTSLPPELLGPDGVPLEKPDDQDLEKRALAPGASPNLLGLLAFSSGLKDAAVAVRVWDTFKDTSLQVAWRSLPLLAAEKDEAQWRPIREAAERVRNHKGLPDLLDLGAMVRFARNDQSPPVLEYAKVLAARAAEWRALLLAGGSVDERQAANELGQFRAAYLEQTDVKAWVAFLDEEAERAAQDGGKGAGEKVTLSLPRVLTWPAGTSAPLPGQCEYLWQGGSGGAQLHVRMGPGSTSNFSNSAAPANKERAPKLQEALALAKQPAVRIALRLMLDPAAGEEVMQEIKEAPQATLYSDVLRASWARKNDRVDEAVKILQEAAASRAWPDRYRRVVDELLFTLALETDENGNALRYEKSETVMNAARDAGKRLATVVTQPGECRQLSYMMGGLGMTAESKQMLARSNPVPPKQQQARVRLSSYYGNGTAQTQASQLLEKGRRDLALRIIARELKNMARAGVRSIDDYYVRQWTQLINRFGLEPALKSAFQISSDEKNPAKLRRSAFLLSALGSTADANALWEKVLAANPADDLALQRVLQSTVTSDMAAAQKLLGALKPEQYGVVGFQLGRLFVRNQGNTGVDQTALMKLVVEMLERLKPEDYDKAYVGWVQNAVSNFSRGGRVNRNSLPSLFERPRPKSVPGLNTAAYEKEMSLRQELLDRCMAAAVKIPGSARDACAVIAALRISGGAKEEDQVPLIREALKLVARGPHAPYPQNSGGTTSYGTSAKDLPIPDPEAFLARQAFAGRSAKLLEEVDKELKETAAEAVKKQTAGAASSGQADQDSSMSRYRTLYFGTDKEVLEMLKRMNWPDNPLPEVFVAMERRGIEPGLAPLVAAELKRNSYSGSNLAGSMLKLLLKVKAHKEAGEFMSSVAEALMGKEDKRAGAISSGNSNSYYFLTCFADRGDAAQQFFLTDQYWRHYARFLTVNRNSFSGNEWKISGRDLFALADAKTALETLRVSPFLTDAASFNALPRAGERTLFESCGETIGKFPKEEKAKIINGLEPEVNRLGTALLTAYVNQEKPGAALLEALAAHEEEFKKLPPEKGAEWAWLHARIKADVKPEGLSVPMKALLDWLEKFTAVKGDSQKTGGGLVDQFLAAKSFKDLGIEYHQLDGWLPGPFQEMLDASPERSGELFRKFRALAGGLAKGSNGGSYGYYIEYTMDELLQLRSQKTGTGAAALRELRGMCDAWQAPEGYPLPFEMVAKYAVVKLEAVSRGPAVKGKAQPLRIEPLLAALRENFEERHAVVLLPWVQRVAEQMAVHDKPEVKAAMEKLAAESPEDWIHRLLRSAVEMRLYRHQSWKQRDADVKTARDARATAKKEGKTAEEIASLPDPQVIGRRPVHRGIAGRDNLPAYQEAIFVFSEDRNVNVNVRAGVLMEILRRDEASEPALLVGALRVLGESWRSGCLLNDQSLTMVASRLALWLHEPGVSAMPELKTVFRETVGAWRAALRKPGGTAYNGGSSSAGTLLDLAIFLNDDETISGILSAVPEQVSAPWMVRLLGAGKTEAAARIVLNGRDSLVTNIANESLYADASQWTHTAAVQEKAPAFLASLQSPSHRALAAALLANFPDAPGLAPRDERMVAAAKLLPPSSAGASGDVNARTVSLLAGNGAARRAIAPQIAEAVKDVSLTMLPDAQDRALAARRRILLEAHLINSALAGNFNYVKNELTAMVKLRSNNDSERMRMLMGAASKIIAVTNGALGDMSAEARAANRTMWAEFVLGPEWSGNSSSSNTAMNSAAGRLFHAVLLHAKDDKMDEWRALFDKQSEEVRRRVVELWQQMDLSVQYRDVPAWPWPKDEDVLLRERSHLTVQLMQTKMGFPGFFRTGAAPTWLRDRIKQKFLRKEDVYAVEDMFRKDSDRSRGHGGIPAVELAELYRLDGGTDRALEWLKVAGPLADEGSAIYYFMNLEGQARVYQRMGKPAEALALLQAAKKPMFEHKEYTKERAATFEQLVDEMDSEVLTASGPEKAMASLVERLAGKPDEPRVWSKFVMVMEMLGKQSVTDRKWAEAADWFFLGSAAATRLGAKDKSRVDPGRAAWNAEHSALALAQGGAAAPDFMTIVPRGALWRYLDDGAAPPPGWRETGFDDSPWPEGPAPLGYGDPGMGTEIKPGGADAANHAITTSLRHRFEVKDPAAVKNLELNYRVDDGCVVYLNGKEIVRLNLPEGEEIQPATQATKSVSAEEETRYHKLEKVDPALLKAGTNLLAVEVHQDKPASSDLVFDASLVANIRPLEEVYAGWWRRPMTPAVDAFWKKLPESFRTALQKAPEPKPEAEAAPAKK